MIGSAKNNVFVPFFFVVMLSFFMSSFWGAIHQASAQELKQGNPDCSDCFEDEVTEFKIDQLPEETTYTDGTLSVTIENVTDNDTFDWVANMGVDAVIVKGGDSAHVYDYDPEADTGSGLTSPDNPNNDDRYDISHVSFCYDVEDSRISLEPSGANEVGNAHTFTATVETKIGDGSWEPSAGTEVQFSITDVHGSGASFVDGKDTCTTDENGQCSVEITSDSAGTFEVTASATVEVDNANTAILEPEDTATKVYADASIGISPQQATNPVGEEHTFTVSVTADDGNGDDAHPVAGVQPSVSITPGGYQMVSNQCADTGTDANGECTFTINSNAAETYTANASVTLDVSTSEGTVSGISRSTDGDSGPNGTGSAEKTYTSDGDGDGETKCTLTQGYWRNHAGAWPEGYDPDSSFLGADDTWMEVLETPPRGNAFYVLAHQYIAARLNVASGASAPSSVETALQDAEQWLKDHIDENGVIETASPGSDDGEDAIDLSKLLESYNEGEIGPGHCDESEEEEEEEEEE